MSKALLRQGLEIVDSDCFTSGKKSTNKTSVAKKKKGVKKQEIKLQTFGGKTGKSKYLSIEAVRKRLLISNDKTEENLRLLQKLSSSSIDSTTTNKIFERAGRSSGKPTAKPVEKEKAKSESTAFTEDDFKKFESEYFVKK